MQIPTMIDMENFHFYYVHLIHCEKMCILLFVRIRLSACPLNAFYFTWFEVIISLQSKKNILTQHSGLTFKKGKAQYYFNLGFIDTPYAIRSQWFEIIIWILFIHEIHVSNWKFYRWHFYYCLLLVSTVCPLEKKLPKFRYGKDISRINDAGFWPSHVS